MRLFAAVELDLAIHQALVRIQRGLDVHDPGIRWLTPEQMHLTLKFLGEVPDDLVCEVCAALAEVARETPAFDFELSGVGCFPPAGAVRIVWAGLHDPTGALAACRECCERVFETLGFSREHRAYQPHLTIARVRSSRLSSRLREAVARCGSLAKLRQAVDEIVLFESVLKREGPRYVAACRCPLPNPLEGD